LRFRRDWYRTPKRRRIQPGVCGVLFEAGGKNVTPASQIQAGHLQLQEWNLGCSFGRCDREPTVPTGTFRGLLQCFKTNAVYLGVLLNIVLFHQHKIMLILHTSRSFVCVFITSTLDCNKNFVVVNNKIEN